MEEVRPPADYVQTDNSSSEDESSTSSPLASRESSNSDLKSMVDDNHQSEQIVVAIKKPVSLDDRSRIPNSFYLSASLVLTAHFCGNIWSQRVVLNWAESMQDAGKISWNVFIFLRDLTNDAFHGKIENWVEFSQVFIFTGLVVSLLYVLLIAPLRAGFWSGSRSSKHKMHRYMGLAYLVQYFAAWTQYLANYESAKGSYLPHFIALNGRWKRGLQQTKRRHRFAQTGVKMHSWHRKLTDWPNSWFPRCNDYYRCDPGLLSFFLLQGLTWVGRSGLLFGQSCGVSQLCPRKHLLQYDGRLWVHVLQWRIPSQSQISLGRSDCGSHVRLLSLHSHSPMVPNNAIQQCRQGTNGKDQEESALLWDRYQNGQVLLPLGQVLFGVLCQLSGLFGSSDIDAMEIPTRIVLAELGNDQHCHLFAHSSLQKGVAGQIDLFHILVANLRVSVSNKRQESQSMHSQPLHHHSPLLPSYFTTTTIIIPVPFRPFHWPTTCLSPTNSCADCVWAGFSWIWLAAAPCMGCGAAGPSICWTFMVIAWPSGDRSCCCCRHRS